MIVILGADGSMGTRYQAILRYLNRPFRCFDQGDSWEQIYLSLRDSKGVIIATPTETHAPLIRKIGPLRKPILCEKPISKDPQELKAIFSDLKTWGSPFRMMFQYEEFVEGDHHVGPSHYDYFRHGKDGLVWDCMQVIALANGKVNLQETSPIWSCQLNGEWLDLAKMDQAYVSYVRKWFHSPRQDLDYLQQIHEQVKEMDTQWKACRNA